MTNEELKQVQLKYIDRNTKMYNDNKELIDMYNQYIDNIVELFDLIRNNESDLFYTMVFKLLIEIGLLSATHKLTTRDNSFIELPIKFGMNIVEGRGLCRNFACFYDDVFSCFYNYPLFMSCLDPFIEPNDDSIILGNHMINLTKHNDTIYGFDLTNNCLYIPVSENTISSLDNTITSEYKHQGDVSMKMNRLLKYDDDFFKEIRFIKQMLKDYDKHNYINQEEYEKLKIDVNNFVVGKKEILLNFMYKNEELTQEIKKKMLLLK